jgi:beta-lactamase regulating signal transducer with metallopeptidase domain
MNATLAPLAYWLLDFAVLASLLMLAAIGLRLIVRQPAARVSLAWGTWLGVAILAIVTALPAWPRLELAALLHDKPVAAERLFAEALPPLDPVVVYAALENLPAFIEADEPAAPAPFWSTLSPLEYASLAWLVAAVLALGWIGLGWWQTRRLLRRSSPVPAWVNEELARLASTGSRAGPRALGSKRITSAVALGAARPKIVLPADSLREDNVAAIRAALAHEWAHIRHGDLWLLAVERLLAPLLAVHPLFWWLRRVVRLDQEILADAAAAGDAPIEYAEALLAWAKQSHTPPMGLAALSLWESPHTLSRRVTMLLSSKRPTATRPSRGWQLAIAAALLALVGGLSLVTLRPVVADDEERAADTKAAAERVAPEARLAPPPPLPAARLAAPDTADKILIQVVVASVDRKRLSELDLKKMALRPGTARVRSDKLLVADMASEEADKLLKELLDDESADVEIISRPQVQTLNNQRGYIHVGQRVPLRKSVEPNTGAENWAVEDVGTTIVVTPTLLFPSPGQPPEMVKLDLAIKHSELEPQEGDAEPSRTLQSSAQMAVTMLLERTAFIAGPADSETQRAIIVLARSFFVPPSRPNVRAFIGATEAGSEDSTSSRLGHMEYVVGDRDPVAIAKAVESRLRQMGVKPIVIPVRDPEPARLIVFFSPRAQTEAVMVAIDELVNARRTTERPRSPADPFEPSKPSPADAERSDNALRAGSQTVDTTAKPTTTAFRVQSTNPDRLKSQLDARLAEHNVTGVKIAADKASGSIIVSAPAEHHAAVSEWIAQLDQPRSAAQTTPRAASDSDTPPATPARPALPVRGQRFVASFAFPESMPADEAMTAVKQALAAIEGVEVERISIRVDERANSLVIEGDAQLMGTISKVVEDLKKEPAQDRSTSLRKDRFSVVLRGIGERDRPTLDQLRDLLRQEFSNIEFEVRLLGDDARQIVVEGPANLAEDVKNVIRHWSRSRVSSCAASAYTT